MAGSLQHDLFSTVWGLSVAATFDALLDLYRNLADSERMTGNKIVASVPALEILK